MFIKNETYTLSIILLLLSGHFSFAQSKLLTAQELDNTFTFTSLEMALAKPDSVIKLSLKHKKLKIIPPEVFTFKNLQKLDLSKNKLEEIPAEINTLTQLQELNVSNNNLTTLPIQISGLANLKKLMAFQNNIVLLPTTIGQLQNLEVLDLWSNEIVDLPEEIAQLKNLKQLDLRGIMMTEDQKERIKGFLPHCNVQISPGCNCLR